jgi:hypothetical protein
MLAMSSPSNTTTVSVQKAENAVDLFFTPDNPEFPFALVYKSLSSSKKEIRLVEILPAKPHETLSLKLVHGCFLAEDDHQSYEALSYCAGDVNDNKSVLLDGFDFRVFKTLFQAQLHLRPSQGSPSRIVWLDQICINQHNVQVKNGQVMMMKSIYESASCVLSWLGPTSTDPDSSLAFDLIQEFWLLFGENIHRSLQMCFPGTSSYKELMSRLLISFTVDEEIAPYSENLLGVTTKRDDIVQIISLCDNFNALKQIHNLNMKIAALHYILRQPYWTRKWILQEVSAAKDAKVLCGDRSLQILDLFVAHQFLNLRLDIEVQNGKTFENDVDEYLEETLWAVKSGKLWDFLRFWTHAQISENTDLLQALYLTSDINATDPRDKLYSLLSMAGSQAMWELKIKPDYSPETSISRLITKLSERYVNSGLDSFGYPLVMADGILSKYDIPSWCFDFTMSSSERPGTGATGSPTILKAGFCNVFLISNNDMLLLNIRVIPLGVIEETSSLKYPAMTHNVEGWSHFAQQQQLEDLLPQLVDWAMALIDGSMLEDISLLAVALYQLVSHLSNARGSLASIESELESPFEASDSEDSLLQVIHFLGLTLLIFTQFRGAYSHWQLAYLRRSEDIALSGIEERRSRCFSDMFGTIKQMDETRNPKMITQCVRAVNLDAEKNLHRSEEEKGQYESEEDLSLRPGLGSDTEAKDHVDQPHTIAGRSLSSNRYAIERIKSTYLSQGEEYRQSKECWQGTSDLGDGKLGRDNSGSVSGGVKGHEFGGDVSPATSFLHGQAYGEPSQDRKFSTYILGAVHTSTQAGDEVFLEASDLGTYVLRPLSIMIDGVNVYKLVGKCEFLDHLNNGDYKQFLRSTREIIDVRLA